MIDHFSLLAPLYDRVIGPPDAGRLKELLDLPAAGALLDVGGGTGRVSEQLSPLVGTLILLDESRSMLQQAHAKECCRGVVGQAERLPFSDGTFARVLVVDALHHFANQKRAISELVRVLAPGGRLVVEEPDLNRLSVKGVALAEKLFLMRSHFLYPHEIGRLVAANGLKPTVVTDESFTTWVVAERAQQIDSAR